MNSNYSDLSYIYQKIRFRGGGGISAVAAAIRKVFSEEIREKQNKIRMDILML